MPARKLPPKRADAMLELSELILAMNPDELEAFATQLPREDQQLLSRVMAEHHAAGWRSDPAVMAAHLDPGFRLRPLDRFLGKLWVRLTDGTGRRIILNQPGRTGKTRAVQNGFVWLLDKRPDSLSIYATYGQQLADETGAAVRDTLRMHSGELRATLRRDRQQRKLFRTTEGGGLGVAGLGATIRGYGVGKGGVLVLDDPYKDWAAAHSEAKRLYVVEQYRGTLRDRLDDERCGILVTHHRVNEKDITDWLKKSMEDETGEAWELVVLPMTARAKDPLGREPGELLDPEQFPEEAVATRRKALGSYLASALLDQDPKAEEGTEIRRAWFHIVDAGELPPAYDQQLTCLPAGELVFTSGGPRPIESVRVGDMVWSMDEGSKTFRTARVWRSECTGSDDILRVQTRSRSVRVNPRHRVMVRRKFPSPRPGPGGYKAVQWKNEWIPASELKIGDYLVAAHGLPDQTGDTAPNGRVVTEGFMAFAGLLIGDGSIGRTTVAVARHADAPYAATYQRFASEEFHCQGAGLNPRYGYRPERPIRWWNGERSMVFASVSAASELRELGFAGVARTKRVPEWVFGLRPNLILAFLRGYLDSDGAVNTRGHITYSSVNAPLLEDVRHLCMLLGIQVSRVCFYKMAGQVMVDGRTVTRGDMYQLFAFDPVANRRIGAHHPAKAANLMAQRQPIEGRWGGRGAERWSADYKGPGSPGSRPGDGFVLDGARLEKIHTITLEPAEPVYDLGVEGTHTFIAGGLIVHNSWDLKLKDREQGDYVVGQVWGRTGSDYWLRDQMRGQFDHATTQNAIALLAVRHPGVQAHVIEAAGSADEVIPELRKPRPDYEVNSEMAGRLGMTEDERVKVQALRRRGMGGLIPHKVTEGSKPVRVRTFLVPAAEAGNVHILNASWTPAYLDEAAGFPGASNDDQVDATSQALQRMGVGVASITAPTRPAAPPAVAPQATPPQPRRAVANGSLVLPRGGRRRR